MWWLSKHFVMCIKFYIVTGLVLLIIYAFLPSNLSVKCVLSLFYRHYAFVVFEDESIAEQAASLAHKSMIYGKAIIARGPAEQRRRGYSGEYNGKIGHVPTIANDKRPHSDCRYYATGNCTNGISVSHACII